MRIVLLLALAACGSEPRVHRGSCQSTACEDYEGDKKFVDGQRASCKGVGTWSDAMCPAANRLGSCRETHGWSRTRHYYVGGNVVLEKVMAECGAYGTWLPPQ